MKPQSDFEEIMRSTVPLILWLLLVFAVIMGAPSIDTLIFGR